MSLIAVLLILIISAAILITVASVNKSKTVAALLATEQNANRTLEEKFKSTKKELTSLKESLAKKSKFLDEARESSKKKMKKEALKANNELENTATHNEDSETGRLKNNLEAMKMQLRNLQSQNDKIVHEAEQEIKNSLDTKMKSYQQEIDQLKDQLSRRKKDSDKQRRNLAGVVPTLDIDALSDEATQEVARLIKKVDNYEKLYGVSQGKLQMSQERFSEMQKKYFAVCRELALAVGSETSENEEKSRQVAEEIITATENVQTPPAPEQAGEASPESVH